VPVTCGCEPAAPSFLHNNAEPCRPVSCGCQPEVACCRPNTEARIPSMKYFLIPVTRVCLANRHRSRSLGFNSKKAINAVIFLSFRSA
jgi:hypothetical protein